MFFPHRIHLKIPMSQSALALTMDSVIFHCPDHTPVLTQQSHTDHLVAFSSPTFP